MVAIKTTASQVILALGIASTAFADSYANFFDDQSCSVNSGEGVDMNNNGCLNEYGRGSVYIPDDLGYTFGLCTYLQSNCQGGANGAPWVFTATGFCEELQTPGAASYRFIDGDGGCP